DYYCCSYAGSYLTVF
nr:immunoglobulin light chain junction region [Macaca mulatta]MOW15723.1 immunoglobulin light chain junction region [Macaca mulatta]MOW16541.1 immunoglobulin light chain junction region [Macaca mulatta]MOW17526.1 immunoglobulin light chain junction region [Macaca mulatta]MOW18483.1 immunoglobulin light chain junction region [Macaca mulatta]